MVSSMTAYGRAENTNQFGRASCEIRSVNHRYLEMSIRMPEECRALEQTIRDCISAKLNRGKVDCNIRLDLNKAINENMPVNQTLLQKLIDAVESTNEQLKNPATINPVDLLRWPGVMDREIPDLDAINKEILGLIETTLDAVIDNRQREGAKIKNMITERTQKIKSIVSKVHHIMPEIIEAQREKYRQRIQELVSEIDNDRLEQEILLLIQKMDVAEEMDRLKAHVEEVEHVLNQSGPIGRRLDFLMQELNREANTLGSKSAHLDTSNSSVDLKVLIEQMREQIQNIE